MDITTTLRNLGLDPASLQEGDHVVRSPIDGGVLARLPAHRPADVGEAVARAQEAFLK